MQFTETTVKYLWADEGKWLTDGEIFAKAVKLAEGRTSDEFHEITEEEYINLTSQEEDEVTEE